MLMSATLPLPQQVFGHGFLTKDGQKMGKSLGNVLDPFDLVDRYGSDAVRYYFLKEIELGKDGDFSENRFVNILNSDLANDLGNLLNRTLGMVHKYCQGKGPQLTQADLGEDNPLKNLGQSLSDRVLIDYEALRFNQACESLLSLIRLGNKYIDDSAPWRLFKTDQQPQVEEILYSVLESVRFVAYLLSPIIPNLSTQIYQQLGFSLDFNQPDLIPDRAPFSLHHQWGVLSLNTNLSKPQPIFAKLEMPTFSHEISNLDSP
jgi:methionyl-tRNA synthetase